jgi:tetratricopeptide (TPR) repeat protein
MGYPVGRRRDGYRAALLLGLGVALIALVWFASSRLGDVEPDLAVAIEPAASSQPAPGPPVPAAARREPAAAPGPVESQPVAPVPVRATEPPRPTGTTGSAGVFQRAVRLQTAGDLDGAARVYRSLLAEGALPAAAHNNLGLIHQQRGDLARAQQQFELAVRADPEYARGWNNLGVVLLAGGHAGAAAERFRRAADLDPRDPDALVNLALAVKAAGHGEQAKEYLLQALGLDTASAPAHYNLAVLYDRVGESARAVEHYRAFLDHAGSEHASRAAAVRARLEALDRSRWPFE